MTSDIRFIAKSFIDKGYAVVPLVKGEKRASSSWRDKTYSPSDFGPSDGIALKCGEPSDWLVDVDLDCAEAIAAAKELLPNTGLVHGRSSKPSSHFWFRCEGIKTSQFTDVEKGGMLVEVRSTGGYTAVPPSGHPSGETLTWESERAPMDIEPSVLYEAARDVALVSILARHWPGSGQTHATVGPLAGFLCHAGMESGQVVRVIAAAAGIARGDVRDVRNYASSTVAKFRAGEKVTGGPKLIEQLGEKVVAKMRGWLKLADLDAIEEMNTKHFWVRLGKDDVIGREDNHGGVVFQRPKNLYSEYANRKIVMGENEKTGKPEIKPLFVAWLEAPNRRSYKEVVFAPPPLDSGEGNYNLWTGYAIEPAEGRCDRFLEHMHEVICGGNDAHYEYLTKLCAYTLRYPGLPSEVATVLRGKPGTGKGTFIRAFQRILGRRHFAHLDRVQDLVDFNALISGKVVVFADEAFWAGDKREIGALKRIITEPTVRVTRKGIDSVEEANCIHLFMATNEEWSVPAQLRERRFFALNVSEKRMQDTAYFNAVEEELSTGGAAAFLFDMIHKVPVTATEIRQVPMTKELRTQQTQSMSPELKFWYECLCDGKIGSVLWSEWIPSDAVFEAYKMWSRDYSVRLLDKIEFSRRLSRYISAGKSQPKRINGEVSRCWHLRTLDDARSTYDTECGSPSDWPTALSASNNQSNIPF
jgi:uncharacterized protein DUF5906/bifunctional DNA primase/polymerase-like protein